MTPSSRSEREVDLTVIIPARDAAGTLPAQIRALARSEYPGGWEVVLVDDASTDDTAAVARAAADDAGIDLRVVEPTAGSGPSVARNVGAAASDAPIMLFCDADDVVAPGWVAHMAEQLDRSPIVTGRLRSDRLNDPVLAGSRGSGDRAPSFLGLYASVSAGNLGVRREAWEAVGPFDPGLTAFEDAEWAGRAALAGIDVAWAPEVTADYRFRTGALDLWRQGRRYGQHRPIVARRWYAATGDHAPRLAGLRSWIWLAAHVVGLRSGAGRARWCWVAGSRVGSLVGSLRARFVVL